MDFHQLWRFIVDDIFKAALGVEAPWFIESVAFDAEHKRLDIRLAFERGSRFEVENAAGVAVACPVYDTVEKSWRHLNFFQHECYLHARVPRVTTDGGRVAMALPPWSGKLAGFTLLFEALLIQLCTHMPVHQVMKMTNVSDYKLWRMLDVYVQAARFDQDWRDVAAVGMDETSIAKGHAYITLFVDVASRKTLHVAEGKGSETVKEFVKDLKQHAGTPGQITDVTCDMSPAFIKGVQEHLPNAAITFDKFHILKIINEAVDEVRREEAKTNPLLAGARYLFLKNDANLTQKQRQKKQELQVSAMNLQSMEALRMRENFQAIYRVFTTGQFVKYLRQWVAWVSTCGLTPMEKAAQMVLRHWHGIVRWKQSQLNNGILEGLNSVIQAAKRKARGYKLQHFITMTYLLTAKLNLANVNPHCKLT
jgi:transposase